MFSWLVAATLSDGMRRTALTLALGAAAALTAPATATAGTYVVKVCHNLQSTPPGVAGGWSTVVGGSALSANAAPAAWVDVCSRYRNNVSTWGGVGGAFGDTAAAGSYAFAKFVSPAGSNIVDVRGFQDLAVTNGSYGEAGIFATSGRALADNSYFLNGGGESSQGPDGFGVASIGADGAQGLMFGGRCPSSLPPAAGGYCGGAGAAYTNLEITVDDPSGPTLTASLVLDSAGRANLTWSGGDPQSGIATTTVARAGAAPTTQQLACFEAVAPPCPVGASGSSAVQLAEGETATYTVSVATKWGGTASKTMSVTRPKTSTPQPTTPTPTTPTPTTPQGTTPTPTTPPPPAAATVTLKTKALKGRRVALSGSARGCKRVSIKTPGAKRSKTARVKGGKWSLTVPRKRGTYRASCGAAAAKRSVR